MPGFAELHCHLADVATVLEVGGFNERVLEGAELDIAFALIAAGREQWFEPTSIIDYRKSAPITADDVQLFAWRWDMQAIRDGYRHMARRWGIDCGEHDVFSNFLLNYNGQRRIAWPHPAAQLGIAGRPRAAHAVPLA